MSNHEPNVLTLIANRTKPTRFAPQKWENFRSDYITGLGSLRELARKHGLKLGTVEARCRREHWTMLRRQREENALKGLIGSPVCSSGRRSRRECGMVDQAGPTASGRNALSLRPRLA
ncbi:MAG: hypothetical protein HY735_37125 [Verrucomicrobia bacterium]|nr:hypothetical protein [Verrucomicrobiota bacterium]